MGELIDFETFGLAALRRRVAAVEEANRDLAALARGHTGSVAAIHAAALAAADADGAEHLVHVVTQAWPDMLGVDAVAFAVVHGHCGWRGDASGLHQASPGVVELLSGKGTGVLLRDVSRGHALFGPACDLIRAEAIVRPGGSAVLPIGVLLLGQRRAPMFGGRHGSEPLLFLGCFLQRILARWLPR